jgi:hypothetical protein
MHLSNQRTRIQQQTASMRAAQQAYDNRILTQHLPPLLARLRAFRGAGGYLGGYYLSPIADQIEGLDRQGQVAITPFLKASECVKAPSNRKSLENRPTLQKAITRLKLVVHELNRHRVQIDFTTESSCPRLRIGPNDERFDLLGAYFVPSQTLLVSFDEGVPNRKACVPWDDVSPAALSNVIAYSGQWTRRSGGSQYRDSTGNGDPYAFNHKIFPQPNSYLVHNPILTPVLRLYRLLQRVNLPA